MTAFLLALGGTCLAMPFVMAILRRKAVLDVPNQRSSHRNPTPRGAGTACLFGVAVAGVVALGGANTHATSALLIGACVLAVAASGLVDDLHPLPPFLRLAVQLSAGAGIGLVLFGLWGLLVGASMTAVAVNSVNFMDGINGISGVTFAIWGGTLWWASNIGGSPAAAFLGAAAIGSALAFLPFNAPRARIFLGDSGSYLFGALIATGLLIAGRDGLPMGVVVAPLLLHGVDVAWTLLQRALHGAPLTTPHRDHVYQQLVHKRSLSHSAVTGIVGCFSIVLVVTWAWGPSSLAVGVSAVIATGYLSLPSLLSRRAIQADA